MQHAAPQKKTNFFASLNENTQGQQKSKKQAGSGLAHLMQRQAATAEEDGDLRSAAEMYLEIGGQKGVRKAVEIFCKLNALEPLIDIVRQKLPQSPPQGSPGRGLLLLAIKCFKANKNLTFAKEAIAKLGDIPMLLRLHMDNEQWESAFLLCQKNPEFSQLLYLPYADFLIKRHDAYEEAIVAFREAGRFDLSIEMLETLCDNAINERRFADSGKCYWKLANEIVLFCLNKQKAANAANPVVEGADVTMGGDRLAVAASSSPGSRSSNSSSGLVNSLESGISLGKTSWQKQYAVHIRRAELYYAYDLVHASFEDPFTTMTPENVFNVCTFMVNTLTKGAESHTVVKTSESELELSDSDLFVIQGGADGHRDARGKGGGEQGMGQMVAGGDMMMTDPASPGHRAQGAQGMGGPAGSTLSMESAPPQIKRVNILFALAKHAYKMRAFKLARSCFQQLQMLFVNNASWQAQIDLASLTVRAKPFSDPEELQVVCYRCMTTNPLLSCEVGRGHGDACVQCGHPFIRCFLSFDVLPLVEFEPDPALGLSSEQVKRLIWRPNPNAQSRSGANANNHATAAKKRQDGWNEGRRGGADVLGFDDDPMRGGDHHGGGAAAGGVAALQQGYRHDSFVQRMLDTIATEDSTKKGKDGSAAANYRPLQVDRDILLELDSDDVHILDQTHIIGGLMQGADADAASSGNAGTAADFKRVRFFRNMIGSGSAKGKDELDAGTAGESQGMRIVNCNNCGKFFHRAAWEKETLQTGRCPFCFAPAGQKVAYGSVVGIEGEDAFAEGLAGGSGHDALRDSDDGHMHGGLHGSGARGGAGGMGPGSGLGAGLAHLRRLSNLSAAAAAGGGIE